MDFLDHIHPRFITLDSLIVKCSVSQAGLGMDKLRAMKAKEDSIV